MRKTEQIQFRIYPNRRYGSHLYYLVRIFRTKAEMREWAKRSPHYVGQSSRFFRFEAMCTAFDRLLIGPRGGMRRHNNIGHLIFSAEFLGAGLTAHEIAHATVYWMARHTHMKVKDLYKSRKIDERFAETVGSMQGQFWKKYFRAQRRAKWLK